MANNDTSPNESSQPNAEQTHRSSTPSPSSPLPPLPSTNASPQNNRRNSHLSTSSPHQTQLSLSSRLLLYLRLKRKYVCNMLLVPIYSLIILIIIGCITFWYLKSFDVTLLINEKHHEIKGQCVPLRVALCQRHRVPYAYTQFPNANGQSDQSEINHDILDYEPIISVKCYTLLPLFLCSLMAPKCNSTGVQIPPSKSLCNEAKRRCNFFLAVFAVQWPIDLNCDELPDSPDPDICVGHQENRLLQERNAHFCSDDGFRCDTSRCIPSSWRCDGFIDCQDSMDEKSCYNCSSTQFYCGNNVCIDKEDICDGIRDCPDGRDERQCLHLSKSMGHNGEGRLEAWNGESNTWQSVCGENWDVTTMSVKACHTLGYRSMNETRIRDDTTFGQLEAQSRVGINLPINARHTQMKILFDKGKKRCNGKSLGVFLKCNHFECGKPAQHNGHNDHNGQNNRKRRRRIVGGDESTPGQWPWLVAIHGGPEEVFFCGGVLISQWWILTAAHCIGNQTNINGWTVNLGITRRTASPFFVQKRHVSRLLKHPGFNPSANMYSSDIALILLDEPVEFDEFLRPVCLPPNSQLRLLPGTYCTVIGWGKSIHDDNADYLSTIHEVQVPIVSHKLCVEWYAQQDVTIPRTMLCAGYAEGKKDSCQGDSGGPLLCRDHGQSWFVTGVVSWGINCAQPHLPGIYTNVPMFMEWIRAITMEEGHSLPTSLSDDYYK